MIGIFIIVVVYMSAQSTIYSELERAEQFHQLGRISIFLACQRHIAIVLRVGFIIGILLGLKLA